MEQQLPAGGLVVHEVDISLDLQVRNLLDLDGILLSLDLIDYTFVDFLVRMLFQPENGPVWISIIPPHTVSRLEKQAKCRIVWI